MKRLRYKIKFSDDFSRKELPGKRVWVKALRSGKYKQGTNALCSIDHRYCCLGVLSKVQGRLVEKNSVFMDGPLYHRIFLAPDNPLNSIIDNDGGFPSGFRVVTTNKFVADNLASMNDCGYTFRQIANVIDKAFYDPEFE